MDPSPPNSGVSTCWNLPFNRCLLSPQAAQWSIKFVQSRPWNALGVAQSVPGWMLVGGLDGACRPEHLGIVLGCGSCSRETSTQARYGIDIDVAGNEGESENESDNEFAQEGQQRRRLMNTSSLKSLKNLTWLAHPYAHVRFLPSHP